MLIVGPMIRPFLRLGVILAVATSALTLFCSVPAQAQQTRYRYAGFLQDAQALTLQIDMAADRSAYQVNMGGDMIGLLAGMYPFHMQLTSQGRFEGEASLPSHYRSDISTAQQRNVVTLTYSAGGNVEMVDQPATQEGKDAFVRGLVRGTMDPLSAVAMIARRIQAGQPCSGRI